MKLFYRNRVHPFRSKGLFVFLQILRDAYPDWVEMARVETQLPGIHARQLARFIDLLEAADFKLVRYETKTRGRFQLAVKPELIHFSEVQDVIPPKKIPKIISFTPDTAPPLSVFQESAWVVWVVSLLHSTQALHDGHLSGNEGALAHLDAAEIACKSLPLWAVSVVHIRRAFVLERESRYREAAFWLRRIDTAVRRGHAHPAAKASAQLVRAKILYNQARYAEAERLLNLPLEQAANHHPNWLNMNALISGRKLLTCNAQDAPALLAHTLATLAEAIGYVFLTRGDISLLDGLCFNFANNLLRGIKREVIPESCADTAMQWLAANLLACRKLGIGDDSIFASLLLIDASLDHQHSINKWPKVLRSEITTCGDLNSLLSQALIQARRTGNRLEVAQCLIRQLRLAISLDDAKQAYFEAIEIFIEGSFEKRVG